MRFKLVIFDFDGTLANSLPWMLSVIDEIADRHHFPRLSPEDLTDLRGPDGGSVTSRLRISKWRMPLIMRDGRRMMAAHLKNIHLFDGVHALLTRLHAAGTRIAVLSSNSEANARKILGSENAALVESFECGASMFGKGRKFRRLIKQSGLPAESILSIGDEVRDVTASVASGLTFAGVSWGLSTGEALTLKGASHIFGSVSEIGDFILGESS
ncbi:MAG: HAD hydrolase-like protein [Verrucomicrobium sp.]|nr:HAD hydrolase-like protein [Verrucomicrobium sp.]